MPAVLHVLSLQVTVYLLMSLFIRSPCFPIAHKPLDHGAQGVSSARSAERREGTLDASEHRGVLTLAMGSDPSGCAPLLLCGHLQRCPDEAYELAGDTHHGDVWPFASVCQVPEAPMQALVGTVGEGNHSFGLAAPSPQQGGTDSHLVATVVRGLDQQASNMTVAGLGDRSTAAPLAARVLTGNQAEIGHELA